MKVYPYDTPPLCTSLGMVAQPLYHRTMCTKRLYLKYILGRGVIVTVHSVIVIGLISGI